MELLEKQSGIYSIENKLNKHRYIGSAVNTRYRQKPHLYLLERNKHHSPYLNRSWNKYGKENFKFSLLESVEDKTQLIPREQYWLDTLKPEYNVSPTAGSSLGIKRRPETIEKLRKLQTGLKHPAWRNLIKSIAQRGENHWTKKKSFSQESKIKMSNSHKNLFLNGYIHPNKGKTISEEQKQRIRQTLSIPVLQFNKDGKFIKEWESIKVAAEKLDIWPNSIINVCKNKHKIGAGFIWKYKTLD